MPIDEKKLAALAKKNAAKVAKEKSKVRRRFDDTLPDEEDEDPKTRRLFKEMKKREF
jgi:hypothetical protein